MPKLQTLWIAGAALGMAFALPIVAQAHDGKRADANMMTIIRANGSAVEARNTTPQVPRGAGVVVAQSPFAQMNQMAAAMDRQMAAMMRSARSAPNPSSSQNVSVGGARAGMCMQSVEVTQIPGQEPQVVRRSSGNCGAPNADAPAASQRAPQVATPAMPRTAPAPQTVPRDSI